MEIKMSILQESSKRGHFHYHTYTTIRLSILLQNEVQTIFLLGNTVCGSVYLIHSLYFVRTIFIRTLRLRTSSGSAKLYAFLLKKSVIRHLPGTGS